MDGETKVSAGNRRRVQVRKERKDGFGEAKRRIVLDHLAACCNITRAAAAAGVSAVTVNYHRRRDPAFAAACSEAIEAGYDALEAAMMERASGGGYAPGRTETPGAETVDSELALHLLSLRRKAPGQRTGRGGPRPRRVSERELNEAILAKLEVLDRRLRMRRDQVRKVKSRPLTLPPPRGGGSLPLPQGERGLDQAEDER